jgi:hypothetical protein
MAVRPSLEMEKLAEIFCAEVLYLIGLRKVAPGS